MKAIFQAAHLRAALQSIERLIPANSPLGIVTNVLIEAGKSASLTGTDLNHQLRFTIPAKAAKAGAVAISAGRLLAFADGLKDDAEVLIEADDTAANIKSGKRRARLAVMPADEFPLMEPPAEGAALSMPPGSAEIIAALLPACSQEQTRYWLQGVHLVSRDGQLWAEGASHLGCARRDLSAPGSIPPEWSIILPPVAMGLFPRLFGEAEWELQVSPKGFLATAPGVEFRGKLIEAPASGYPDLDRVVPPPSDEFSIEIDAEEACRAAHGVASVSEDHGTTVKLMVNGSGVEIASETAEASAEDFLECAAAGDRALGLSAKWLKAYLGALEGETVRLSQAGPGKPVRIDVIGKADRVGVIMPVAVA